MKAVPYVCLAAALLVGAHAHAQLNSSRGLSEFNGHLKEGNLGSYSGLIVEVSNLRDHSVQGRVDVASDGSFNFRAIPDGDYQVRVVTVYGNELASTVTAVGPSSMPFEFRMPSPQLSKPGSGTVSVEQLKHPLSKQVRKLLAAGHRLAKEQHYGEAVARFQEAAKDAPDCMQVHAELGMAFSRMGAWDDATAEYRTAVALEPRNSMLHSNLGAALAATDRIDEAEREAQVALKMDSANPRAHYVLGSIILRRRGALAEAVSHLVVAQDVIPSAKAAVEKICSSKRLASCPE